MSRQLQDIRPVFPTVDCRSLASMELLTPLICRTIGCQSVFARWWQWPHARVCSYRGFESLSLRIFFIGYREIGAEWKRQRIGTNLRARLRPNARVVHCPGEPNDNRRENDRGLLKQRAARRRRDASLNN